MRLRGLERPGAGALGHQRQQLLDGQDRVAEDAVTDRGASGLGGIIGDVPQPDAVRQVIAGDVGVVPEDGRADDDSQVMSVQMPGQRPYRERQAALVQRMILGERRPLGGWRRPHRDVHLLGQGDGLIPARSSCHGRAEDQYRPLSLDSRETLRVRLPPALAVFVLVAGASAWPRADVNELA